MFAKNKISHKSKTMNTTTTEKQQAREARIDDIFEENETSDLTYFLEKRKCLNQSNMYMAYIYNTLQTSGILITSLATGYSNPQLAWFGIGCNFLAQLLSAFEHINISLSNQLNKNITLIKEKKYTDESTLDFDLEKQKK